MKKIKKILALSTAAVMAFSSLTMAAESADYQKSYTVFVNDDIVDFTYQKPYNENGSVFVPVRGVFEAMGFEVDYEPVTKTAYLTDEFHSIEITLGNTYFKADGKTIYPETPQFILNDCFMIPLRAVSEAVDAEVSYNNSTYIIDIAYDTGRDEFGVKEGSLAAKADEEAKKNTEATTAEEKAEATTEKAQSAENNLNVQLNRIPFEIDKETFWFGQKNIPSPFKKVPGAFGFTWNIYMPRNGEYYMLGTNNSGEIVAFYALTSDFSFEGLEGNSRDIKEVSYEGLTIKPYIRESYNKNLDGRLYALFVCQDEYMGNVSMDSDVLDGIKFQLENMINTIRLREGNGIDALEEYEHYHTAQEQAESAAKNHGKAEDTYPNRLSDSGYDGIIVERYLFEDMLRTPFYFDIFDDALSDLGVYNSITYGGFYYIDIGLSYNTVDNILCYAHNIFITDEDYYADDYDY